jgi:hypothetical protein
MTEQTTSKPKRRYAREPEAAESAQAASPPATKLESSKKPAAQTKIGKVIALLKREEGATLDEMVKATAWQPHTTRAALTGLKKKGFTIERSQRDGGSVYRVSAGPA